MNLARGSVPLVTEALRTVLTNGTEGELVGVSCLARLYQIFARVVLECGGALDVILPAADYRERKVKPDNVVEFDDLLSCARTVRTLLFDTSDSDTYTAASEDGSLAQGAVCG